MRELYVYNLHSIFASTIRFGFCLTKGSNGIGNMNGGGCGVAIIDTLYFKYTKYNQKHHIILTSFTYAWVIVIKIILEIAKIQQFSYRKKLCEKIIFVYIFHDYCLHSNFR